ncbi:MAG TPA: thiamine pyrophosphate-binding protein, partial [Gaiellaceae bacterium]|nr:thiamine pyrophosphate-binding protein [Gaiellaceae bacterium]
GIPGGAIMPFYHALWGYRDRLRHVLCRHEQGAGHAAEGYARASGRVGVCVATSGPGATNLVTPIADAWMDSTPLVAITGQVSSALLGTDAFQETDITGITIPITKHNYLVTDVDDIPHAIAEAFHVARSGRPGPVLIDITKDAQQARTIPQWEQVRVEVPGYTPTYDGDRDAILAAARLLERARRPLILAGNGVIQSEATEELRALAERLDAPVVTTPSGRGSISETHRLAFGVVGLYRTWSSAKPYDEADCLVLVGTRMEEFQSGLWKLVPQNAKVVQVDIDAFEIARNIRPDAAVVGDAKVVLAQLREAVPATEGRPSTAEYLSYKEECEWRVDEECRPDGAPLRSKQVLHPLNQVFGDFVLVNENGGQDLWSYYCPYVKVTATRGCVAPAEQTCMGFGVAGAIGAKLARPEAFVVCVTGDGAFQMYLQEMATALQYEAPVVWVVLDNAALGWCKWIQRATGEKYIATDFQAQPDFVRLAEAYGVHGERVEEPGAVAGALDRARQANDDGVPAVLSCAIDPWDYPQGFTDFHRDVWGLTLPA